jgi:glycerophosphoryl diester phosphodiesterase
LPSPIFLLIIYFGAYFLMRGPLPAPQAIAHRGGRTTTPESTLLAFQNAITRGMDALEFDVQMTADGELVVIHDDTVDRTTNGTGAVKDMTLDELRALDAGNGEQIPTFEEVIQLAKDNGVDILPEAKSPDLYPGLPTKMVELLEEMDYLDHAIIQSFVPATFDEVRAANPDARTCALFRLWEFNLSVTPASDVCPMAEMALLYPWMIRSAHERGQQVFLYFGAIEHPLTMRLMFALGADGVMVDDPAALANILNR